MRAIFGGVKVCFGLEWFKGRKHEISILCIGIDGQYLLGHIGCRVALRKSAMREKRIEPRNCVRCLLYEEQQVLRKRNDTFERKMKNYVSF